MVRGETRGEEGFDEEITFSVSHLVETGEELLPLRHMQTLNSLDILSSSLKLQMRCCTIFI
jgi:hypothetical protein